jgi:trehalose utilization protein
MKHLIRALFCSLLIAAPAFAQFRQTGVLRPVRVVIWDEQQPQQKTAYDNFLGNAIADYLKEQPKFTVKSVRMDDREQGLPEDVLNDCDVLVWWGHVRHREVKEDLAKRILARIKAGKMSMVVLHSAHWSKPFILAMNDRATEDALKEVSVEMRSKLKITYVTPKPWVAVKREDKLTPTSTLEGNNLIITLPACVFPAWRADGKPSHVSTLLPGHPIAKNVPQTFDIPQTEMYDEPFHVPPPDWVIFEERWDKGEKFRSGCLWRVGQGMVFYFRPGHETYAVYKEKAPLKIIENACRYLGEELPDTPAIRR